MLFLEADLNEMQTREGRFSRLHAEHFEAVRRYVWRRDPSLADDVVAETFLIAWRRIDEVPTDARPWLIAVARNARLNARRSRRRQQAVATRLAEEAPSALTAPGDHADIGAALAKLSANDREILLLSAWDDLDRSGIATVLGCSKANVSLRLHRARRRFSDALARQAAGVPVTHSIIHGGATDAR